MARLTLPTRVSLISLFCFTFLGMVAHGDARSDYLVNMLENGSNYRIRVQAATNLGKIRARDAVPSLLKALNDGNELVVIAAASALGQIGEASAIKPIEDVLQRNTSKAARSQLEATLRVLRALSPESARPPESVATAPLFLIRVDAMGDSSKSSRSDSSSLLKQLVTERVSAESTAVLQPTSMSGEEVVKSLHEKKMAGYILSGSVLALDRVGAQIVVKVSLNVFSNPDYNLLMMPSAQAAVPLPAGVKDEPSVRATEEKALRAVVQSLMNSIFQALRDMNEGP